MESSYDDMVLFHQSSVSLEERILLACQRTLEGNPINALRKLQCDGFLDQEIVAAWVKLYQEQKIPEAHVTFGFIQQIAGDYKTKVLEAISTVVNKEL